MVVVVVVVVVCLAYGWGWLSIDLLLPLGVHTTLLFFIGVEGLEWFYYRGK